MNTRKLRKAILTLCSALLLVSLSVGLTVAYLTDTDEVVNTFTTGKVQIKLDEAAIKADVFPGTEELNGNWVEDSSKPRRQDNQYKLYPGRSYAKDPTVTILQNSEDAYVRVFVTLAYSDQLDQLFAKYQAAGTPLAIADFVKVNADWQYVSEVEKQVEITEKNENGEDVTKTVDGRVIELRYKEKVLAANSEAADFPLVDVFTTITIPGHLTEADMALLNNVQIKVVAQAIQAEGFADANAAWNAWVD